MSEMAHQAKAVPAAHGWRVMLQTAPDRIQYICAFESERQAQAWIDSQLDDWLRQLERGL